MNPIAFIETAAATRSAMLGAMAQRSVPPPDPPPANVSAFLRSLRAR